MISVLHSVAFFILCVEVVKDIFGAVVFLPLFSFIYANLRKINEFQEGGLNVCAMSD